MLKKRLIATIIVKNNLAVQSIGFNRYLPIGKPEIAAEFLNEWGIDEIALIDIDASKKSSLISLDLVKKVAGKIFTPLSVGGGINSIESAKKVFESGADKIILNSALDDDVLVQDLIKYFGKQAIVASIDVKKENSKYMIYDYKSKQTTIELKQRLSSLDIAEVLLNSVDRDGSKNSYDIELYKEALRYTNLPIIALGGAKNPLCMRELLDNVDKISAVGAGNFFHYSEHSVAISKMFLKKDKLRAIRHDGVLQYKDIEFDNDIRIKKQDDEVLKDMIFEKHIKESI